MEKLVTNLTAPGGYIIANGEGGWSSCITLKPSATEHKMSMATEVRQDRDKFKENWI